MFQNEKIVEIKTCKHCSASFEITDKDLEFYEKVSPVFAGKKYNIPTPQLCPDCRQQRRLSFRNERKLYKRKCDGTGKDIISIYSPDKKYKVYNQDYWWSDNWDPLDYGKYFDFNRSFFEQFEELSKEVPRPNSFNTNSENCGFCNYVDKSKNCYMSFLIYEDNEDLLYSYWGRLNKNCVDISISNKMELCYDTLSCSSCYKCMHIKDCFDCNNCLFSSNLISCANCILCTNLVNKSFCINNKQYSKEEYNEIVKKLNTGSFSVTQENQKILKNIQDKSIHKNLDINLSENCLGDNLTFCKNVKMTFKGHHLENVAYSNASGDSTNIYDIYSAGYVENSYYGNAIGNSTSCLFTSSITASNYLIYCEGCDSSSDCFGCIGLHNNKQYCILNKQYTKSEYETLVPKIIEHMMTTGEWGEFFPSSISPFGYNETVAMEYFPIGRDVALQHLYTWSDYEPPFPKVDKIIPANKLPEDIKQIPDDILNRAIECEITKKPFKIIAQELEFYRKHNLPIPRHHPDQRHLDRMALRNPRKLFDRKCDKCGKNIKTTYAPDRKEIVYCEECYNKTIY